MKKKYNYRNRTKQIWEFCSTRWQKIVHISGITILAILFARFIVYDLMSLSVFAPMEKFAGSKTPRILGIALNISRHLLAVSP